MDLDQRKLNKSEWDSIEVPVTPEEKDVLRLIIQGYHEVNIRLSKCISMFSFLKVEQSEKMEDFLYVNFMSERVEAFKKRYKLTDPCFKMDVSSKIQIKSADKIRLGNTTKESLAEKEIYDFVLLQYFEDLVKNAFLKNTTQALFYYFSLFKLLKNNVQKVNRHILALSNAALTFYESLVNFYFVINQSPGLIEKNKALLKYADLQLYEHQKQIFTLFYEKEPVRNGRRVVDTTPFVPKLVLYIAPTGTGKTLTPLALSEQYRVVFVCAARHVGLALAKAAISMEKKIAFAFGCGSATDIRLHYYAAKEFTINARTGGIGKVDNSVGTNVEIMICDIKSYYPAMLYMKAFNPAEKIITYWDEPTITMDYDDHSFHKIINRNWTENSIPNVVLSSATLPKLQELTQVVTDFKAKFPGAVVVEIVSHDCKKSIPLINKDGFVFSPHFYSRVYKEVQAVAKFTENYLTLLRYFDLQEVVDFIGYLQRNDLIPNRLQVERFFETLDDFDMKKIKYYYLVLLQNLPEESWDQVCTAMHNQRRCRIPFNETVDSKGNKISKSVSVGPGIDAERLRMFGQHNISHHLTRQSSVQLPPPPPLVTSTNVAGTNGLFVTTKDAYTLTDGPTIFISDDVEKIAKFCIQQANIPPLMMKELMEKIEFNNVITDKLEKLESELEYEIDKTQKSVNTTTTGNVKDKDLKKLNRVGKPEKNDIGRISEEIQKLKDEIKTAVLNDTFVPNKRHHLDKWAQGLDKGNSFTSNVDEITVNKIMSLHGVDDSWKILLLLGIGVFTNHKNIQYTEIMKQLAIDQKLYLIIATSDYIYGTNYSFCHGYLSKELNLTQEKIIQALGRIGRNNIQQEYTVRFRDDEQFRKLFSEDPNKPEVRNMNRLFNSENPEFLDNAEELIEDGDDDDDDDEESS